MTNNPAFLYQNQQTAVVLNSNINLNNNSNNINFYNTGNNNNSMTNTTPTSSYAKYILKTKQMNSVGSNQNQNLSYSISNKIQEKLRQGSSEAKSGYSEYLQNIQRNTSSINKMDSTNLNPYEPSFVLPVNTASNLLTQKRDSENVSINSKKYEKYGTVNALNNAAGI